MIDDHAQQGIAQARLRDNGGARLLVALCVAAFLGNINSLALGPFLKLTADDLDTSVAAVGQSVTALLIFSALIGLVAGPVADHIGHRRVMLVGMSSLIVCAIGTAAATNYLAFVAIRLIGGLSVAILNGLSLAIIGSRFQGEARRRAMSIAVASLASGPIVGTPILAWIGDVAGWRFAFLAIAAAGIAGMVLLGIGLPPDRPSPSTFRLDSVLHAYTPLLRHGPSLRIYGANALRNISWIGSLTYIGAYMVEERDLSLQQVGMIYMVGGAGYFMGSLAAGGRIGRFNLATIFSVSTATAGVAMGCAFAVPVGMPLFLLIILISGFVGAAGWVALTTLLIGQTPAGPATTMILNGSVFNLGSALGGAAGGLLLATGGYGAIGVGLPVFALMSAALVLLPALGPHAEQQPALLKE